MGNRYLELRERRSSIDIPIKRIEKEVLSDRIAFGHIPHRELPLKDKTGQVARWNDLHKMPASLRSSDVIASEVELGWHPLSRERDQVGWQSNEGRRDGHYNFHAVKECV
jgi:hypothetical protein